MGAPKSSRSTDQPESESAVAAFLAGRLKSGERLCVALSGGQDSVVLLHILSRLVAKPSPSFALSTLSTPSTLSALHVHHGLSPNADRWAQFCADFCRERGVPLSIVRVEVPRASGEGIEAAARRMRHAAFADCAADWLALAHHRDDQAETVLLNLLRGAGVAGAAGMLAERPQGSGPTLIRPLLDVAQVELSAYARQHGLAWIDDESNDDTHFRRNYLRHDILPLLDERFPGARPALARAAGHFAEASVLLDDLAALDRQACMAASGRIALRRFNALSGARARNLLRAELAQAGFRAPQTRWLDEALRQLASAGAVAETCASETCVSTSDGDVQVYRGEIYAVLRRSAAPVHELAWRGERTLPWAGGQVCWQAVQGQGISQRLLAGDAVRLKSRQGGERLRLAPNRPRRQLRNLLQEGAIPPWERARLPCLWCGEQLVWVGGVGADDAFACAADEPGWLLRWDA